MESQIRSVLGKIETVGREILWFEELDSTNTYGKQLARAGAADGTVILCDHQTAGRGRLGRNFQSPGGKGIYLTALLRPELPPEQLMKVTALAGVAVCNAVERICGVRPGLKWPNDPVLHGKKLSGILTESVIDAEMNVCVILGIGVNVSQRAADFTPEVAAMATSLEWELGRPVSRPKLIAALIEEVDALYAVLKQGNTARYLAAYRRDCVNLGKPVQLMASDGKCELAEAVAVDEGFGLVVRTQAGGEKIIRSGEVSVRGLYGYTE